MWHTVAWWITKSFLSLFLCCNHHQCIETQFDHKYAIFVPYLLRNLASFFTRTKIGFIENNQKNKEHKNANKQPHYNVIYCYNLPNLDEIERDSFHENERNNSYNLFIGRVILGEYFQTDYKNMRCIYDRNNKTTTVPQPKLCMRRERVKETPARLSRCRQIRNYLCVCVYMNTSENIAYSLCVYFLCAVVCHKNKIVIIARGGSVCLSFLLVCFVLFFSSLHLAKLLTRADFHHISNVLKLRNRKIYNGELKKKQISPINKLAACEIVAIRES